MIISPIDKKNIKLRKASMDDGLFLFNVRNDPVSRANSMCSEELVFNEHVKWLEKKLDSENCTIFIAEYKNYKVGMIRVDISDEIGEISFAVHPEFRGMGLGTALIENFLSYFDVGNISVFVGIVKKDNKFSEKCFLANCFTKLSHGDFSFFIKRL